MFILAGQYLGTFKDTLRGTYMDVGRLLPPTWLNMMQHVFHWRHQLLRDGGVEDAVSLLKRPLVVVHHPLGAHKSQPEHKAQNKLQSHTYIFKISDYNGKPYLP